MTIVTFKTRGGTAWYKEWYSDFKAAWKRYITLSSRRYERIQITLGR